MKHDPTDGSDSRCEWKLMLRIGS